MSLSMRFATRSCLNSARTTHTFFLWGDLESYYPNTGGSTLEKVKAALEFCDSCPDIPTYNASSVNDPDKALGELTTLFKDVGTAEGFGYSFS